MHPCLPSHRLLHRYTHSCICDASPRVQNAAITHILSLQRDLPRRHMHAPSRRIYVCHRGYELRAHVRFRWRCLLWLYDRRYPEPSVPRNVNVRIDAASTKLHRKHRCKEAGLEVAQSTCIPSRRGIATVINFHYRSGCMRSTLSHCVQPKCMCTTCARGIEQRAVRNNQCADLMVVVVLSSLLA